MFAGHVSISQDVDQNGAEKISVETGPTKPGTKQTIMH